MVMAPSNGTSSFTLSVSFELTAIGHCVLTERIVK
jgi:hypothetical protein